MNEMIEVFENEEGFKFKMVHDDQGKMKGAYVYDPKTNAPLIPFSFYYNSEYLSNYFQKPSGVDDNMWFNLSEKIGSNYSLTKLLELQTEQIKHKDFVCESGSFYAWFVNPLVVNISPVHNINYTKSDWDIDCFKAFFNNPKGGK